MSSIKPARSDVHRATYDCTRATHDTYSSVDEQIR